MYQGIRDIAYEADVRLTALAVRVDQNVEDSYQAKLFEAQALDLFKCDSYETAVHYIESQSIAGRGEPNFARRKVLIVDEDIEDLTRNTKPFEVHGFEVHKCTHTKRQCARSKGKISTLPLSTRALPSSRDAG